MVLESSVWTRASPSATVQSASAMASAAEDLAADWRASTTALLRGRGVGGLWLGCRDGSGVGSGAATGIGGATGTGAGTGMGAESDSARRQWAAHGGRLQDGLRGGDGCGAEARALAPELMLAVLPVGMRVVFAAGLVLLERREGRSGGDGRRTGGRSGGPLGTANGTG